MGKRGTSRSIDDIQARIWKQIIALCVPIFFASFFQQSLRPYQYVYRGPVWRQARAGRHPATMSLTELAVGFSVGLGAGCAVITGQFFGSHDDERLSRSVHTAMTIALVLGLIVSVAGVIFIPQILQFMETPQELVGVGIPVLRCYFGAMVFALLLNMGTALLRAVGDTRAPALIIASGCVINVILDIILVAWLGLEALGCGIATATTIFINCCCGALPPHARQGAWRLDIRKLGVDGRICRSMLSCGMPLAIQSSVYSVSNVVRVVHRQHVWRRRRHRLGPLGRARRDRMDGNGGAGRRHHHVRGSELRSAQLRAPSPGLPHLACHYRVLGGFAVAVLGCFRRALGAHLYR